MKLDSPTGRTKYSVISMRRMDALNPDRKFTRGEDLDRLRYAGVVLSEEPGSEHETFVLVLKDRAAQAALLAYAKEAEIFDPEYADEVRKLAQRSGPNHPNCKTPD